MLAAKLQADCVAVLLNKAVYEGQRAPQKVKGDVCARACATSVSSQTRQSLQAISRDAINTHQASGVLCMQGNWLAWRKS